MSPFNDREFAVIDMLSLIKREPGIDKEKANSRIGGLGRYASRSLLSAGKIVEFDLRLYVPEDFPAEQRHLPLNA